MEEAVGFRAEERLYDCARLALGGPLDHGWLDGFFAQDESNVYHRLCYWLVRALEPDVVVELGTVEGRCAAHMGAAREDMVVHAVDEGGMHGAFERNTSWLDNVIHHAFKPTEPRLLAQIVNRSVGLCVVDDVHAWDHVLEEVEVWTPKMALGGLFLFDDLDWDNGMRGLLDRLPFGRKGRMDEMHPGHGFGWAVVER